MALAFAASHVSVHPHTAVKRYLHKEGTREQLDATRNMITRAMPGALSVDTVNLALAVLHERMRSYGYPEYIGNDVTYLAEEMADAPPPMVEPSLPEEKFREGAMLRLTLMRYSLHLDRDGEFTASPLLEEAQKRIRTLRQQRAN